MWIPNYLKPTIPGQLNPILQDEYQIIKECSQRHHNINGNLDESSDYDLDSFGDLPIFRKDPWDYYNDLNNGVGKPDKWYVRQEVVSTMVN